MAVKVKNKKPVVEDTDIDVDANDPEDVDTEDVDKDSVTAPEPGKQPLYELYGESPPLHILNKLS